MYDIRSQDNYEPIWHYVKHIEKRISNPLTRAYSLRLGMRDNVFQYLRSELQNGTISISWNDMIDGAQDAEWLQSLFHRKKYLVGSGTWNDNPYGFEVDQEGFVKIYTDGACLGNGKPGAKAGIGVYFNDHHTLNVSEPLDRQDPATNNVAEIKAIIKALDIVRQYGVERVNIITDSKYFINCIESYIFKWLRNGWIKIDGQAVIHRKQYRELLEAMENMDLKWTHVGRHLGVRGNVMADMYAKQGARRF